MKTNFEESTKDVMRVSLGSAPNNRKGKGFPDA